MSLRDALAQSLEVVAGNDDVAPDWIQPLAFNVVIEMDPTEQKTKGGIILVESVVEREKLAGQEGTLVAKSPLAFSYAEWPDSSPPPDVGARVLINKYAAGTSRERDGKEYRIIEDKSVIAVLSKEDK